MANNGGVFGPNICLAASTNAQFLAVTGRQAVTQDKKQCSRTLWPSPVLLGLSLANAFSQLWPSCERSR